MKVTFDSNLWEQIVHPHRFPKPAERHLNLLAVHRALKDRKIAGYISESVLTMEGIKRKDRARFLTTQPMRPRILDTGDSDIRPVILAPDQSDRPPLMPVLNDRVRDAVSLGLRLIKLPIYNEMEIPTDYFAAEPPNFIDRYGVVAHAINSMGVGRAALEALGRKMAARAGGAHVYAVGALPSVGELSDEEEREIAKAVAEASDGDAITAHIAIGNDYFATEDVGKSAGSHSVLDREHRERLYKEYGVRFVFLDELARLIAKDYGNVPLF